MTISATIEDYLGILFIFERDGEPVVGARIAALLGVSAPTVTNTLKRMARDGLVTPDPSGGIQLTPEGRVAASSVMRRHMLAEWMLTRMLSWSKVHREAHEIEHAISKEVEEALMKDFQNPTVCPHGNPLPGCEATVSGWAPLTGMNPGETATVRRIHELAENTPQLLSFLEEKGISPGVEIRMVEKLPFNQTVTLEVKGQPVAIGMGVANFIFVERAVDAASSPKN